MFSMSFENTEKKKLVWDVETFILWLLRKLFGVCIQSV